MNEWANYKMLNLKIIYQSKLEHPLHPQCLHITNFPCYKSALGTLQMHVVL